MMDLGAKLLQDAVVDGNETPLSKPCQISADALVLVSASDKLWHVVEAALNHFRWSDSIDRHLPQAVSEAKLFLNRVSQRTQDFVFEILSVKVDELLDSLGMINFEPKDLENRPHSQVDEIINFLQITFMCITQLPHSAMETAYETCCIQVSKGLMRLLSSAVVSKVNLYGMIALDLDVKR
jgi:hypothetical protein